MTEDEIYSKFAKLYCFVDNDWEDRGTGEAKLLKDKKTRRVRFMLRQEKTMKVLCNHLVVDTPPYCNLLPNAHGGRCWVWTAQDFANDEMKVDKFALKFGSSDEADGFKKAFDDAKQLNKKADSTANGNGKQSNKKAAESNAKKEASPKKKKEPPPSGAEAKSLNAVAPDHRPKWTFVSGIICGIVVCGVLLPVLLQLDVLTLGSCEPQLTQLRSQMQEEKQSAAKSCESARAQAAKVHETDLAQTASAHESACEEKLKAQKTIAEQNLGDCEARCSSIPLVWTDEAWPECLQRDVVLKGAEAMGDLASLFGSTVAGCKVNDCTASSKFGTSRPKECAHACATLEQCSFWTHVGEECFLYASSVSHEVVCGATSAAKACKPAPTKTSRKQAVLAVLESSQLRACDGGQCPDFHSAMRTWEYAIRIVIKTLDGVPHNFQANFDQILNDATLFLTLKETSGVNLVEMYSIFAGNNRLVLENLRSWVNENGGVGESISALDLSVPRPVRGLLCQGPCPTVA